MPLTLGRIMWLLLTGFELSYFAMFHWSIIKWCHTAIYSGHPAATNTPTCKHSKRLYDYFSCSLPTSQKINSRSSWLSTKTHTCACLNVAHPSWLKKHASFLNFSKWKWYFLLYFYCNICLSLTASSKSYCISSLFLSPSHIGIFPTKFHLLCTNNALPIVEAHTLFLKNEEGTGCLEVPWYRATSTHFEGQIDMKYS